MRTLRLRQAVVAAADRDAVVDAWTSELGTGAPFHDPGVGDFALCNSVVPVGDAFLEVVSPLEPGPGSAAGRHMARHGGDCGYMAIFQVEDIASARSHLGALGIRSVLDIDLDDIHATHAHPADMGAAIVSFDQPIPEPAWRWAGPGWTDEVRTDVVDGLAGIVLADADAHRLLARWGAALDVEPADGVLRLVDDSYVRVTEIGPDGRTGIVGIDLWAAPGIDERSFEVAGVQFRLVGRPTAPPDH